MMTEKEQVDAFLSAYNYHAGFGTGNNETLRKALGAYEQSKWVKFDVDDETTHPRDQQVCNVVYHTGRVNTDKWSDLHRLWVYASCQKCVTHWQSIPGYATIK